MIKKIKKRDGRIINFIPEKITAAIYKAAKVVADKEGSEASYDIAEKLTQRVVALLNKKYSNEIPTVEQVQDAVVKVLIESGHAKTSQEYILYRAERTRIRETKTRLMKTIETITLKDANESDTKRENANIDGNTAMGTMLQYGSTVSKEFCKSHMLKPKHAFAHDNGDIHIHDLDFFNMGTLTCTQIDILKLFKNGFSTGHGFLREPQDIMSYAALAAIAIQSNQNDQHGGQSIPTFDYGLAPGVKKTYRRLYIENMIKALVLNFDLEDEEAKSIASEIVEKSEKASEEELRLKESDKYKAEEISILKDRLNINDVEAAKIQKFVTKHTYKETDRRTYQAMEAFIHNLNTMHSRAGAQVPFSSVNFGTDTSEEGRMVIRNLLLATEAGLGNGETPIFPILIFKVKEGINYNVGDPNYDLFKLSCRVSAKRLFPNFSFLDAPFNAQYYVEGRPETEATYMGCRTRVIGNVYDKSREIVTGRGNISFSSINLPRLGIKYGQITNGTPDIRGFFEDLDSKVDLLIDQLMERLQVQQSKKVKNFPFLMGQGVWIDSDKLSWEDSLSEIIKHGTLTVGFIGLAECLKALIGKHHGESEEAQELGIRIVKFMRDKLDANSQKYKLNFSLIATPAEGLSGRFTRLDKKMFGVLKDINDRDYYTNSFHIPVYYKISAFDKIKLEAPYHELTNAGHITYIELDGNPSDNLEAFETVVRAMHEAGIGYGSINHPVDRDPVCGYNGVIHNVCPRCGRTEADGIKFERIRRITGYLVGTIDRFNDAKLAEVKDRTKHGMR
ncbi:anaerobic ribonucleoside triphosphate reductase [Paramaledivibacter caminithermalis]|uniref:Ribonucleoside-triphosphate reductase class III catalytic subunit n=1 Tax=Paramaledivibacter caminithermalis (strain DSM 15212 / CIP 107654 / DViRD3) TaxID=1121301 RepID=A0A1M6KQJ4_PARC5|nr:anaerobic ribonucleoside triphosphate reductase [Paramaledivibacter caminithermalis]SHJ61164.1 ribonucleoside-triphosphate reductase class III catalytic subunit [Paramaledivibacter caminithermalis DSM 15212]